MADVYIKDLCEERHRMIEGTLTELKGGMNRTTVLLVGILVAVIVNLATYIFTNNNGAARDESKQTSGVVRPLGR